MILRKNLNFHLKTFTRKQKRKIPKNYLEFILQNKPNLLRYYNSTKEYQKYCFLNTNNSRENHPFSQQNTDYSLDKTSSIQNITETNIYSKKNLSYNQSQKIAVEVRNKLNFMLSDYESKRPKKSKENNPYQLSIQHTTTRIHMKPYILKKLQLISFLKIYLFLSLISCNPFTNLLSNFSFNKQDIVEDDFDRNLSLKKEVYSPTENDSSGSERNNDRFTDRKKVSEILKKPENKDRLNLNSSTEKKEVEKPEDENKLHLAFSTEKEEAPQPKTVNESNLELVEKEPKPETVEESKLEPDTEKERVSQPETGDKSSLDLSTKKKEVKKLESEDKLHLEFFTEKEEVSQPKTGDESNLEPVEKESETKNKSNLEPGEKELKPEDGDESDLEPSTEKEQTPESENKLNSEPAQKEENPMDDIHLVVENNQKKSFKRDESQKDSTNKIDSESTEILSKQDKEIDNYGPKKPSVEMHKDNTEDPDSGDLICKHTDLQKIDEKNIKDSINSNMKILHEKNSTMNDDQQKDMSIAKKQSILNSEEEKELQNCDNIKYGNKKQKEIHDELKNGDKNMQYAYISDQNDRNSTDLQQISIDTDENASSGSNLDSQSQKTAIIQIELEKDEIKRRTDCIDPNCRLLNDSKDCYCTISNKTKDCKDRFCHKLCDTKDCKDGLLQKLENTKDGHCHNLNDRFCQNLYDTKDCKDGLCTFPNSINTSHPCSKDDMSCEIIINANLPIYSDNKKFFVKVDPLSDVKSKISTKKSKNFDEKEVVGDKVQKSDKNPVVNEINKYHSEIVEKSQTNEADIENKGKIKSNKLNVFEKTFVLDANYQDKSAKDASDCRKENETVMENKTAEITETSIFHDFETDSLKKPKINEPLNENKLKNNIKNDIKNPQMFQNILQQSNHTNSTPEYAEKPTFHDFEADSLKKPKINEPLNENNLKNNIKNDIKNSHVFQNTIQQSNHTDSKQKADLNTLKLKDDLISSDQKKSKEKSIFESEDKTITPNHYEKQPFSSNINTFNQNTNSFLQNLNFNQAKNLRNNAFKKSGNVVDSPPKQKNIKKIKNNILKNNLEKPKIYSKTLTDSKSKIRNKIMKNQAGFLTKPKNNYKILPKKHAKTILNLRKSNFIQNKDEKSALFKPFSFKNFMGLNSKKSELVKNKKHKNSYLTQEKEDDQNEKYRDVKEPENKRNKDDYEYAEDISSSSEVIKPVITTTKSINSETTPLITIDPEIAKIQAQAVDITTKTYVKPSVVSVKPVLVKNPVNQIYKDTKFILKNDHMIHQNPKSKKHKEFVQEKPKIGVHVVKTVPKFKENSIDVGSINNNASLLYKSDPQLVKLTNPSKNIKPVIIKDTQITLEEPATMFNKDSNFISSQTKSVDLPSVAVPPTIFETQPDVKKSVLLDNTSENKNTSKDDPIVCQRASQIKKADPLITNPGSINNTAINNPKTLSNSGLPVSDILLSDVPNIKDENLPFYKQEPHPKEKEIDIMKEEIEETFFEPNLPKEDKEIDLGLEDMPVNDMPQEEKEKDLEIEKEDIETATIFPKTIPDIVDIEDEHLKVDTHKYDTLDGHDNHIAVESEKLLELSESLDDKKDLDKKTDIDNEVLKEIKVKSNKKKKKKDGDCKVSIEKRSGCEDLKVQIEKMKSNEGCPTNNPATLQPIIQYKTPDLIKIDEDIKSKQAISHNMDLNTDKNIKSNNLLIETKNFVPSSLENHFMTIKDKSDPTDTIKNIGGSLKTNIVVSNPVLETKKYIIAKKTPKMIEISNNSENNLVCVGLPKVVDSFVEGKKHLIDVKTHDFDNSKVLIATEISHK